MTDGQLAMPSKAKPTTTILGGARPGAGRKTDAERSEQGYIDYNEARAKREFHNARIAEMEERKLAGELAEVADFDETMQKLAANIRSRFVSLPSKTAPSLVGLETVAEIEAELTRAVWESLSDLSGYGGT
jgi:phage terminase Nu1 subunit (DNA packaging protein)